MSAGTLERIPGIIRSVSYYGINADGTPDGEFAVGLRGSEDLYGSETIYLTLDDVLPSQLPQLIPGTPVVYFRGFIDRASGRHRVSGIEFVGDPPW